MRQRIAMLPKLTYLSTTKVTMATWSGHAEFFLIGTAWLVMTDDLEIDTTVSGLGGLDGIAVGTSQWVYLYLVSNAGTLAAIAHTNSPGDGAPPSYTTHKCIGAVWIDGAGAVTKFDHVLPGVIRYRSFRQALSTAAGTDAAPVALTLDSYVPKIATAVSAQLRGYASGGSSYGYVHTWVDGEEQVAGGGVNDDSVAAHVACYQNVQDQSALTTSDIPIPDAETTRQVQYQRVPSVGSLNFWVNIQGWLQSPQ